MCMMKHCCVFANKIEFGAKAWLGYCAPLQCDLAPGAMDHASMSEGCMDPKTEKTQKPSQISKTSLSICALTAALCWPSCRCQLTLSVLTCGAAPVA